MYTKS